MTWGRRALVRLHRYAGLAIAGVLVVAGLTGSLLAFLHELEGALNPHHRLAEPEGAAFEPLAVREAVLQRMPQARVDALPLHREAGEALHLWIEVPDPARPDEWVSMALVLDPFSARELSRRSTEIWPLNRQNLMAFVYRLHYSLALGDIGLWLFGMAALVWTLDCFVGAWLTLPRRPAHRVSGHRTERVRRWYARWAAAWRVGWHSSTHRTSFDLHRAAGLWTWAMLLAFAWSAVYFNLGEAVYKPVMRLVAGYAEMEPPEVDRQDPAGPTLSWAQAHRTGRALMAEQAQRLGLHIRREQMLSHDPESGVFRYAVLSDRDVSDKWGATLVVFDDVHGRLLALELPTGQNAGRTLTHWIVALHTAAFWGLPMKLFVCGMGLVVAGLSLTGAYLWLAKRRALATARRWWRARPD